MSVSFAVLHSEDRPHIQRGCQREHEAGEQDCRAAPFKLTVLPIIKVHHAKFGEEEHGEDQVDGWEYHIIDHRFDLAEASFHVPSMAPATSPAAKAGVAMQQTRRRVTQSIASSFLFFIRFPPFLK